MAACHNNGNNYITSYYSVEQFLNSGYRILEYGSCFMYVISVNPIISQTSRSDAMNQHLKAN